MPEEKEETTIKTKLDGLNEEQRNKIVTKWKKRFEKAKDFRKPYQDKWLRMYYLYRAYKEKTNYAYQTKLMPPKAFEIIETVKPRLASAKMNVRILPRDKGDIKSKSLEAWDDLIKYDFDVIKFPDRKIDWINSSLQFGNGVAQLTWNPNNGDEKDDGDPFLKIQDLWLFYPDPEATNLQDDSNWEIQLDYKTKEKLVKEEDVRGEQKIYKNLEKVSNKKITDDPRKERYEINTKKMGQISTGASEEGTKTEEKMIEEKVELLQIWDHEEDMLLVIANQNELIRYEKNPYMKVNKGRIFIDLPDHSVLWELWAIGHIEPVETTIHELADSRNQAMDDIVFTLDPIRKTRKDAHITPDDIVYKPGAVWNLKRSDDVVTERPPEISKQWIEKDEMLNKEIQASLAISEYAMGIPKSKTEAMGKVELLLMQTNIRFSLLVRQFEIVVTQLVNNLIEMNQEFLTEDKTYRLVGKEVDFKEFKESDKKVRVDARVEITPKKEKTPDQKRSEILLLYKIFVAEDKPEPGNEKEIEKWKSRKRILQKMILEEFDKEQYEDLILGLEEEEEEQEEKPKEPVKAPATPPVEIPPMPPAGPAVPPVGPPRPAGPLTGLMAKIPFLRRL